MGVATIVERIAAEAEAEATALVADADARATALVDRARLETAARVADALARAEPTLQAEEVRGVNAARLRLLERRAAMAAERTEAVFAEATARLAGLVEDDHRERWTAALDRLLEEALALVGPGATCSVRGSDAEVVGHRVAAAGGHVLALDDGAPAGVVVRSADGRIEVDATLPARLASARLRLAEPVARILGVEG